MSKHEDSIGFKVVDDWFAERLEPFDNEDRTSLHSLDITNLENRINDATAEVRGQRDELLEALKVAEPYVPKGGSFAKFRKLVRDAISKAEGAQ